MSALIDLHKLALASLVVSCSMVTDLMAGTVEVEVKNNSFDQETVHIKVGDTVHWTWKGSPHTVTSGASCTPDGKFDSGIRNAPATLSFTFNEAGSFPYFCSLHCTLGMTGKVIVEATPPPPSSCSDTDPVNVNPIPAAITKDPVAKVALQDLISPGQGLVSPNGGVTAPGDKKHLYVTDTVGKLWAINLADGSKNPILDVSQLLVTDLGKEIAALPGYDERGLLGLAFHPNYRRNGLLYTFTSEPVDPNVPTDFPLHDLLSGTIPNNRAVISEWRVDNPRVFPPTISGSRRALMRIDHPELNHNGGALNFGPDGLLYIAVGDGGNANDQDKIGGHDPLVGNGQDRGTVLGKILRIDPNRTGSVNGQYGIPRSNPFAARNSRGGDAGCADGVCDEIWAYGFRNPFRFSFDKTGNLLAADVGQNRVEEVDLVKKGGNYGWRYKEGTFFFQPNGSDGSGTGFVSNQNCLNVPTAGLIDPIAEYDHDEGIAIVGGFAYAGNRIPALRGQYIFGDYVKAFATPNASGRVFHINLKGRSPSLRTITELRLADDAPLGFSIFGFAQDANGEIYVMGNTLGVPAPRDDSGKYLDTGLIKKLVPVSTRH
ncbi:MAG: PQQ-dependent sugar dehydrogenase [Methylococcaceae bacterium]|nr:PQQ-dependent sugar dehydrogenase [Methylococcaceae bacterium]